MAQWKVMAKSPKTWDWLQLLDISFIWSKEYTHTWALHMTCGFLVNNHPSIYSTEGLRKPRPEIILWTCRFFLLWLQREPGVTRSIRAQIWIFLAFILQRDISCTALLCVFKAPFLFFPTENVYQTCREHARTTDQIHSQTGPCLQHVSWGLGASCFKSATYPKWESNLLKPLNAGSSVNCRHSPSSSP